MRHEPALPGLEVPSTGDLQSSPPSVSLAETTSTLDQPPPGSPLFARARSSVWAVPALKLIGFGCVLTCIAWLGERSHDTAIYGPELAKAPARAVSAHAESTASTGPEPSSAPTPPAPPAPSPAPAGAVAAPCASASVPAPTRAVSALLPDGRLVLNEASVEELDRLPGIGKKRAEEILALRERLGRFKRTADLLRIRGIGPRSLASLKELIVLDRPAVPVQEPDSARSGAASPQK